MKFKVLEMLQMLEAEWNNNPGFMMKKRKADACQDYLSPLRELIRDPETEIDARDWETIRASLMQGFELSFREGTFGAQVQGKFAAIAIAGLIRASS